MKQALCPVASNVEVMPGIYLMWIEASDIACSAQPGQFITVRCRDFTLRRPFSVHQSSPVKGEDSGEGEIALLFKVAGKGTLWLSQQQKGDKVDILGPLGEGFSIPPTKSGQSKHLLLVAGGIGIAPFVFLMQYASSQHQVTLIHGASTAAQLYPFDYAQDRPSSSTTSPLSLRAKSRCNRDKLSPLPNGVQFIPVTEDGSMGQKGMATDILPDFLDWADQVYACGPVDMYKAMAEMSWQAKRSNLKLTKCQVSLEVRMGCGFGACYGCTINTKRGLKQVCRDGPVFELDDIIWQEVRI
jgi:dihydroorotate dehydrogenase electron transfer subunit